MLSRLALYQQLQEFGKLVKKTWNLISKIHQRLRHLPKTDILEVGNFSDILKIWLVGVQLLLYIRIYNFCQSIRLDYLL